MKTTTIKFDTACYNDAKNKILVGCCFAGVWQNGNNTARLHEQYFKDTQCRITGWILAVDSVFRSIIDAAKQQFQSPETHHYIFKISVFERNIFAIASKVGKVTRDLQNFDLNDPKVSAILDRKMRRSNQSRYPYHDQLVKLVSTVHELNKIVRLDVEYIRPRTVHGNTGIAFQHAQETFLVASSANVVLLQSAKVV